MEALAIGLIIVLIFAFHINARANMYKARWLNEINKKDA